MRRLSIFVLGVVLLSLLSGAPSFSQGQPSPLGIVIQPTEFQAFIEVSRPVCAVGQTIEIRYRANQAPYYAYILDIQGNNVTRLLPNRFESNNLVNDTEWKRLPGIMTYQLVCAPPLGPEYVQIIASTERIPQLEGGTGTFPLLGTNPQAVGQQIQAILPAGKVATAVAQLQIVAVGQPQPPQTCPPGTVGTPPFCTPITQPPQPPPGGSQFQVQQVIAPGSMQFFQLSAQLLPLLNAAGLGQALAQAQGMAAAPGQPQALGTAPQQINIQEVQNRCEFVGVMRTDRTANVSGATLPAGTYLQAFCQVNPYLVVIIDVFTGQIVVIIVVVPPPFFTPISIILFIFGWFFPTPGPFPFPWPYPHPFPWPFPVMLPAACSGLPVQNPFSVPIGSGASIVAIPGVMNIRDAGVFFNALAVQSLGPSLSFQRITSLFSIQIGFIGSFSTAALPYSALGTFVLLVQGGGKTACIQGVVGFGVVYGLAANN
jgi:hypothetical protein